MALFAAIVLVSCGGGFMGELTSAYETGAEKVKAAKNQNELDAAKAEVNKQTAGIKNENLEDWNEMVLENKKDSTKHAEEFSALIQAEAKYLGAIKAKEEELQKK